MDNVVAVSEKLSDKLSRNAPWLQGKLYCIYDIINPDIVTYDEMNAWVNNGCDIDWAIMDVLIDGQTFGQRIQSDIEGMAQNNYYMYSDGRSLSN